MKILAAIPNLSSGGAERVFSGLVGEWCRTHDVIVVTYEGGRGVLEANVEIIDIRFAAKQGAHLKLANTIRRAAVLRRIERSIRPDVFVAFQGVVLAVPAMRCLGLRTPTIGSIRTNPARYDRVQLATLRFAMRRLDGIVAPSRGVAAAVGTYRLARGSAETRTIANPVRCLAEAPVGGARVPAAPFVLHIGRMDAIRDQKLVIRAFEKLKRGYSAEVKLVLIGDGPEKAENTRMVAELGLTQDVEFVGLVADPGPWLSRCAALAFSSKYGGWPNAIAEAVSFGSAVVSVDCDHGPREILAGYEQAWIVPMNDAPKMAASLAEVLERHVFSSRRQQIPARWQAEAIAAQWIDFFEGRLAP